MNIPAGSVCRPTRKVYQSLPSTFDNLAPRLQSAQNGSSCPRISVYRKSGIDRHLDSYFVPLHGLGALPRYRLRGSVALAFLGFCRRLYGVIH